MSFTLILCVFFKEKLCSQMYVYTNIDKIFLLEFFKLVHVNHLSVKNKRNRIKQKKSSTLQGPVLIF